MHLKLSWRQEFPFVGDHDYHLLQSIQSFDFWRPWYFPALALVVLVFIQLRRKSRSWIALVSFVVLAAAGWMQTEHLVFSARYPGTFYFLAVPFQAVASVFDWDSPLNALRLTNAMSLPVWLLVLRPLVIRKWPDLSILPAGIFLFWQKDLVYYFTASYLEPWALILVLLAVERLVVFGSENAWKVYLLIGLASMIKEQAILVLPFAFMATMDSEAFRWKRDPRLLLAVVAAAPFILYYLFRAEMDVWRTAGFGDLERTFSTARLELFADRVLLQFGPSIVLVAGAIAGCLAPAFYRGGTRRRIMAALMAAAMFQVIFFFSDTISFDWTGYPRFHLMALVLIAGSLVALGHARRRTATVLAALAAIAIHGVTLLPALSGLRKPDVLRNFSEHFDSPIYFPIDEVLAGDGALPLSISNIRVASNVGTVVPRYSLDALTAAYPRLAKRYSFELAAPAQQGCRCNDASTAVLGLYVHFTNLGADLASRLLAESEARRCHASIQASCTTVKEFAVGDQRSAALGSMKAP
jgi:hypothetical protein